MIRFLLMFPLMVGITMWGKSIGVGDKSAALAIPVLIPLLMPHRVVWLLYLVYAFGIVLTYAQAQPL